VGGALQADGENEVRIFDLKHQKRSMDHFAGLDVSVKETSLCIVDDTGRIVREVKVASEPEALLQVLMNPGYHFKRIGLEAGPLSQWLFSGHRSPHELRAGGRQLDKLFDHRRANARRDNRAARASGVSGS
jgi:hypothetical protein